MVMATPIQRTGGAGGMQSTARLVGQTMGATLVTLIFALVSGIGNAVHVCLWSAIGFAVIAGTFSLTRVSEVNSSRANTK